MIKNSWCGKFALKFHTHTQPSYSPSAKLPPLNAKAHAITERMERNEISKQKKKNKNNKKMCSRKKSQRTQQHFIDLFIGMAKQHTGEMVHAEQNYTHKKMIQWFWLGRIMGAILIQFFIRTKHIWASLVYIHGFSKQHRMGRVLQFPLFPDASILC